MMLHSEGGFRTNVPSTRPGPQAPIADGKTWCDSCSESKAQKIWHPENRIPRKRGSQKIWYRETLVPRKSGTQEIWHPEIPVPRKSGTQEIWHPKHLAPSKPQAQSPAPAPHGSATSSSSPPAGCKGISPSWGPTDAPWSPPKAPSASPESSGSWQTGQVFRRQRCPAASAVAPLAASIAAAEDPRP